MSALLEVAGLKTHFHTADGVVMAVDDVSLAVERGRVLGLVGESGSGKSMTGYSILGLVDEPGRIVAGSIRLEGRELTTLDADAWRHLRGDRVAMIFQDPMMTLNPVLRIDTRSPRRWRHASASSVVSSRPSRRMLPATMRPGSSTRPRIE